MKDQFTKWSIGTCLGLLIVLICVFKYFYPNPAFINGDSYAYINIANANGFIGLYPIGYPKFLRLFSVFSRSDVSLVLFQYFSVQISTIWLLCTLFYLFTPKYYIRVLLLLLATLNPAVLYLANYISSDSLFLALSICWFTTLIWIMHSPSIALLLIHSVIIFLVFIVRYNALFFPFISLFFLLINRGRFYYKMIGIATIFLLIGMFVFFTSRQYKRDTGVKQFSPFSGWQMANNGMFAYMFVDSAKRKDVPQKFRDLDYCVRRYFDTTKIKSVFIRKEMMATISAGYMWTPSSPLRIYMNRQFEKDSTVGEMVRWSRMGPLYGEYGNLLMRLYPREFAEHFLWENLTMYYAPPVEFLAGYGFNVDTIPTSAKMWFGYKKNKMTSRFKDSNVYALDYYPVICAVMNAVFIMMVLSFFLLKGHKINRDLFYVGLLFCVYWVCNLVFSVFASPIALRFQLFQLTLSAAFNFLILDFMLKQSELNNKQVVDGGL